MPINSLYDEQELENSQFASPSYHSPPRVSGRPGRTKVSPRRNEHSGGESLAALTDEDASGGKVSLAYELAAALMPQPSAGSRLLAEEFGLEFEEGAEGIEEEEEEAVRVEEEEEEEVMTPAEPSQHPNVVVTIVGQEEEPPADLFAALSRDMDSMDTFLSHLRHLDGEHGTSHEPPLEKAALELIRRLNETVRDRENQVRQLLELEREFRRLSSEVGGADVLASLDELEAVEGLMDSRQSTPLSRNHSRLPSVAEADEEDWERRHTSRQASFSNDDYPLSPISPSIPDPGMATPSSTISHVTHFRTETKSLANSLTALSEQTQVNGAATAEAGRKIRALKNKLGGWQVDWESAERSRERIAEWERSGELANRIDGRKLAEEHINAFKITLDEAARKTKVLLTVS